MGIFSKKTSSILSLDSFDRKERDPNSVLNILTKYPDYFEDGINLASNVSLPSYLVKCKKILFVGMGASGIAGEIVKDLAINSNVLIETIHDYQLPGWVDSETLVIALSHSGDTEETLNCTVSAFQRNAKIIGVSTGGKLESLCSKYRAPYFKYQSDVEPKFALFYLISISLVILNRLGLHKISNDEFESALKYLANQIDRYKAESSTAVNQAKLLALKLQGKLVYSASSSILRAVSTRFSNQLSENSKQLSAILTAPEFNHNFISGLEFPKSILENTVFISFESSYSIDEIKKRENIVSKMFSRNFFHYERVSFNHIPNPLAEVLAAIVFSDFTSVYLAILNNIDPYITPKVTAFKSELRK